ncbi:uncharacterized protein ACA1_071850 [Acanthamoeba castellanii str. Neff]|uniref:Uncharacterized protein n=1 Tax=Acanthamoeba castellanii (strain ATCC 30010 / Neff) TaxID=1257118 RepID=L8HFR0_ACACF|nr:uncharacterized protein ACA1_071850 [Acanthamoeba castellanii str. Neff]ELR23563.1 hypothetical protein ACA1_071850 [Acanthamoeba castellanii str. Neff]
MTHPAPSGQENRMTQLLLAQAEAIRALSQAALTSPSTGSGRAPGELEPLQDCLALLQLYAGMLDDRRPRLLLLLSSPSTSIN